MVLATPHPPSCTRSAAADRTHTVRGPLRSRAASGAVAVATAPRPQQLAADPRPSYAYAGLSDREKDVLRAWLYCDSKIGVAAELHIALGTINTHLTRIRNKYAAVGRPAPTKAALVARALQDGIVALDDL